MTLSKEETDKFVEVDGIQLHYNEAGEGPALICTHGGGPGANAWDNSKAVFEPLSKHFRTILLDLPGYGESQKLVSRDDVPMDIFVARLLKSFMDELGIDRAHMYGSSQFANASLRFGIEFPDRVGKIIVQSSQFGEHVPFEDLSDGIKSLIAFAEDPELEKMETIFRHFTPREEFRPQEVIEARYEKALIPDHLESRKEMRNGSNTVLEGDLPRLQAEVLYVHGNEDGMIPIEYALDALRQVPNIRAVLWGDRSGHFVLTEHAEEFARIATDFLKN